MQSIKEVSDKLENDLQRYLEATYHLHHPRLLKERRALMNEGETATEPWVEATPTYVAGNKLRDLGLPTDVVDLLKDLEADDLDVFDPPYKHQADALQSFFRDEDDLIVSTGTGSGKTEIFLYSILGQLAQEATRGKTTEQRGMRTLVLYPMNALVADQLSRMRLLFGDEDGAATIEEYLGRRVQFGMYTSRTPYHGEFDERKNDRLVKPIIDRYLDLQREQPKLYKKLDEKGRIPSKNLSGFRNFGASKSEQFQTQPGDRELFTRQEMHSPNEYGGTPDILITNYSMLEYMLLRPIEQPLFEDTKEWLEADEENELTVVLDEAHLYRGAQGAEVALLLSRLLQKLEISRERVRFILTSATMGGNIETAAPEFAAELTTGEPGEFAVITGEQEAFDGGEPSEKRTAEILKRIGYSLEDPSKIRNLASEREWDPLQSEDLDEIRAYLGSQLMGDSLFQVAHGQLRDEPLELATLADELFPDVEEDLAREATGNFLYLCTEARRENEQSLLPTRLHMFLKGLPAQYACVNPECPGRRVTEGDNLLGRIYTNPHTTCPECGSRVFELISHRTCGAAYLRAYRRKGSNRGPTFLWTAPENSTDLDELHLLVEQPRADPDPQHEHKRSLAETTPSRKLAIDSGHLVDDRHVEDDGQTTHIDVWVPTEDPPEEDMAWSWTRCPACGIKESRRHGETKVEDLVTKGEEPFANIVRSMFGIQPTDPDKEEFPNKGRKVLCFSDGRQKAARLARDLQANVELDSFREVLTDIIGSRENELSLDRLFAEFAVYCRQKDIVFFDDSDEWTNQAGVQYEGSRSHFENIQERLDEIVDEFFLESIEEIPNTVPARNAISKRPKQFDEILLRSIGDEYYSVPALLVGYLRPTNDILDALGSKVEDIDRKLLESILIESIRHACEERAFDPDIDRRRRSESYPYPRWLDPDEVGVPHSNIIPDYVVEAVGEAVSEDEWNSLRRALMQTDPLLFESDQSGQGKYLVNPAATTIELRLDDDWYRCEGCRRFAVVSLNGVCPHDGCSGTLSSVGDDDIHLQARKGFFREPPRSVLHGDREPLTLRSEEHSAQLSAKDNSEAFARSEEYELLFQDILVGDNEADQPIDVLSCTTTMEVGIDIGSLTGVAMRTVPPAPENYEQRAGRAGRRGTGLSTIITFADNSPHESHYFDNPEEMITSEGTDPIIYSGNEKIARRHINASLLARYFDPSQVAREAAVFDSLSSTEEFFEGEGTQTLSDFEDWLGDNVFSQSTIVTRLGELLPDALGAARQPGWRTTFIRDTAEEFLSELKRLQSRANWEEKSGMDEDLLSVLLDAALLPTFSFPTDVCDFIVRGNEIGSHGPKTKYEMSRDLKQALSTYVPGREIVVDKKTYESYGLYFKFADDLANRAAGEDWGDLDWLNWCRVCQTVFDEQDESLQAQDTVCPVCNDSEISSLQRYTPSAFAPEVDETGSPEEGSSYSEDRVYATQPKYPLTSTSQDTDEVAVMTDTKTFGPSTVGKLSDEQLMVANFGPDEDGFEVCTECGAVSREGALTTPHNRPYPKDFRFIKEYDWPDQCSGSSVTTSFGHTFPSDLTVLQIPLHEEMEFVPAAEWFETAGQSLAEALVMGASRALGIESDELEGGFRTRSADLIPADDVRGVIEVFLFDTTAGGAGFSAKVWDEFDDVLSETRAILESCDCDTACHNCLRRYENRHLHESLNRHQGLALLEYAETGNPPTLSNAKTAGLIQQLEHALELQVDGISVDPASTGSEAWQIGHAGSYHTFGVRSSLRRSRATNSDVLDEDYSEYQLSHRLPEVAHSIIDQLD